MLALLLATLAGSPQVLTFEPTDDVWVYPHASDPSKDPYLRVWGSEGKSVAPAAEELDEFSYSYLKFNLKTLPKGKIEEATLTLTSIADPGYTADYIKDNPVEARPLKSDFTEKTWEYDIARTLFPEPGAKSVYGLAYPSKWPAGKPFTVEIDLLKGPADFRIDSKQAANGDGSFAIALTSTDDVQTMGSTAVYKFYSKDADKKEYHPVLRIKVQPE
jgi:hypothetical protein